MALCCALCMQTHLTHRCTVFITPQERIAEARRMKICLNCLEADHQASECISRECCQCCFGPHNLAFCNEGVNEEGEGGSEGDSEEWTVYMPPSRRKPSNAIGVQTHQTQKPTYAEKARMSSTSAGVAGTRKARSQWVQPARSSQKQDGAGTKQFLVKASEQGKKADEIKKLPCCALCRQEHWTSRCTVYRTVDERVRKGTEMKICFKCLASWHQTAKCKSKGSCYYCGSSHNAAFCDETRINGKAPEGRPRSSSGTSNPFGQATCMPLNASISVKRSGVQEKGTQTDKMPQELITVPEKNCVIVTWKYRKFLCYSELPIERGYAEVMKMVQSGMPEFHGAMAWKDENGVMSNISSQEDFRRAISKPGNEQSIKLYPVDNCELVKTLTERIEELELERDTTVRNLSEKIDELEGHVLCKICTERHANTAYQCGHTLCSECDRRIRDNYVYQWLYECPFCKRTVASRIHIFS